VFPTVLFAGVAAAAVAFGLSHRKANAFGDPIVVTIGTQDTTTNTVAAGVVIRKLNLLEKYLPKDGKYAGHPITIAWENFTSGPPITNGMMANKLQFGMMGDYPLIVNGFTFKSNQQSQSQLIAVAAYNMAGSGNGLVVNKASPYYSLADLKGKLVSVPFGSAAHGMILRALQQAGHGADFFQLVNQSPEVGSTNLQEMKIDGHADFVPFPELLPHRGFARKIFDGSEANLPTWHGVVVRTDFAAKYPEIVEAYLKAMIEANAWIKADPKRAAEQISAWTGTDKEVVYIYLGPGGIMTLDPSIKSQLIDAAKVDAKALQGLGRIKAFDVDGWVNDNYLRKAFAASGLNYSAAVASTANYELSGTDDFCHKQITAPREAGEVWLKDGPIKAYSSAACTLGAYNSFAAKRQAVDVAYVFDHARGTKLFADEAYYIVRSRTEVVPFMLKRDAAAYAAKIGAKVATFSDALKAIGTESRADAL
jgi:NitT/TauT family transport system substrate-binding protein